MEKNGREIRVMAWVPNPKEVGTLNPSLKALSTSTPPDFLTICGVTGPTPMQAGGPSGRIPYCSPQELLQEDFDILLILTGENGRQKAASIRSTLQGYGLDPQKYLFDFVACTPGFSWRKYRKLVKGHVSMLSLNCFAGFLSHSLALRFHTPTINMFFEEEGFIRMMRHPRIYFEEPLEFDRTEYQETLHFDYPVYRLGDVFVHMNHYPDFAAAEATWYERVRRINWYNLFVVMFTERPEIAEAFDALPFSKKVCLVPFRSDLDSAWQIDTKATGTELPLWDAVNHFGAGAPFFYDPFDMLLYGKKTQLVDMP